MDIASICETGGEANKHDSIGVLEDVHCACLAVADAKAGTAAAETVVSSFLTDFQASNAITTSSMSEFFENAQAKLIQCKENGMDSAALHTAATVLFTDGNFAVWGHIGDSRLYHFKDNLIDEITPDHTAAYAAYEAGRIKYGKIAQRRMRSQLYRVLGDPARFSPEVTAPTLVKPGESFLLCTDGFWEHVGVRQIERALKKSKNAEDWLARMKKIIEKQIDKKGLRNSFDDYSAVAVKF